MGSIESELANINNDEFLEAHGFRWLHRLEELGVDIHQLDLADLCTASGREFVSEIDFAQADSEVVNFLVNNFPYRLPIEGTDFWRMCSLFIGDERKIGDGVPFPTNGAPSDFLQTQTIDQYIEDFFEMATESGLSKDDIVAFKNRVPSPEATEWSRFLAPIYVRMRCLGYGASDIW